MEITLNEILACGDEGTILVAEDRDTGGPVHISSAINGKRCNCICPCCRRDLIARHGVLKKHSFAHQPDEVSASCSSAGETLLHRFAKEVLASSLYIYRPAVVLEDEYGPLQIAEEQRITFDLVRLEVRQNDVVPDVVCVKDGKRLFIEFKVTHAVDAVKRQKLREHDVSVLEVDLSSYRDVPIDQLAPIILRDAPRKFLQSRLLEQGLHALASRKTARHQALMNKLARLVRLWKRRPSSGDQAEQLWDRQCDRYKIAERLSVPEVQGTAFNVPVQVWGLWIAWSMLTQSAAGSVPVWLKRLEAKGWLKTSQLSDIPDRRVELIRTDLDPEFKSARDEVKLLLQALTNEKIVLFDPMGVYKAHRSFIEWFERRKAEVDIPEERCLRLYRQIEQIMEAVPEELKDAFDFQSWLDNWCVQRNSNLSGVLFGDGILFDEITTGLDRLNRLIKKRDDIGSDDLLLLPLERFLQQYRLERAREEEERRKASEAEFARQSAIRVEALLVEAETFLGWQASEWLAKEMTVSGVVAAPVYHSSQSPAGHYEAMTELRREVARRRDAEEFARQKSAWGQQLRAEARKAFGREDATEVWLNSVNRELGMKRPMDVCVDQKSFEVCVQAIPLLKKRRR